MMPEYSANIGKALCRNKRRNQRPGLDLFSPKQSDVRAPNEVPADAFGSNDFKGTTVKPKCMVVAIVERIIHFPKM